VKDEQSVAFGALLRRLRLAAGLTQEELAERAQLSERGVRRLEGDHNRTPRLLTVRLLAQALDLAEEERSHLLAAARPASLDSTIPERAPRLPRFLTPLIGREQDIAVLKLLLDDRRLVTVSGTGGVGKTRLALALAELMIDAFDLVLFVELTPLREPEDVAGAIAGTLSIREEGTIPLFDLVVGELGPERALLVLDNMEHLLTARDIVLRLLGACPDLRIVITSREALHVRGERVYTLGPLPLPEREVDIGRSPAVRLFLDRAREAGAKLGNDEVTARTVAQICRLLDGLPLAIELAATRTTLLPPAALLARLSSLLPYLDHGPRDLPARQRTMRDAIVWSYDLLDPAEQTLFRRLSVFTGGCTLDAAEAVCQSTGHLEVGTLDGLASLSDKSLLTVQETPDQERQPRFGMLETVKEFAREQLSASPEAEAIYREHARYFLGLAEKAETELSGPNQSAWLDCLAREHDNLRAVLRMAQRSDDPDFGLRLVGTLWPFWWARNHYEEAQRWLDEFLPRSESAGVSPSARAYALYAAGALVGVRGDNELSVALLQRALEVARQSRVDRCTAATLRLLGETERGRGNYHLAERLLEESLVIFRQLNDQPGVCAVLGALAGVARYQGGYERAIPLFKEALALSRAIADIRRVADVLARLGNLVSEQGRPSESLPLYEEALALHRQLGDSFGIADVQYRSGEEARPEHGRATRADGRRRLYSERGRGPGHESGTGRELCA
jgi:predicted ATPase/DNA-binding XRE family transcriptional regulator